MRQIRMKSTKGYDTKEETTEKANISLKDIPRESTCLTEASAISSNENAPKLRKTVR
jgi:hypothetical protein